MNDFSQKQFSQHTVTHFDTDPPLVIVYRTNWIPPPWTLCSFITYLSFLSKTSISIKLGHVYLAKFLLSSPSRLKQTSVIAARQLKLFN